MGEMNRFHEPLEIDGHTVVAVFVDEGDERAYAMRDSRETYVRRGSNNVRPDPDHDLRPPGRTETLTRFVAAVPTT